MTAGFPASGSRNLVIGSELLNYSGRTLQTNDETIVLTGLTRGRSGTTAAAHANGVKVGRLIPPAYEGTYVAGLKMMYDVLAPALASKMNLGITSFSYDGSEWLSHSHGALGHNLTMEKVYKDLTNKEDFVHDGANSLPYTWHINSRYNWGETADNILEAQQRRRWANNVYFRRNLMPPSLGWWSIDNANEWRWALAKSASFDAGFAYLAAPRTRAGTTRRSVRRSGTGTTPRGPEPSTGRTASSCRSGATTSSWTR